MQSLVNVLTIFSVVGLMSGELTHFSVFMCALLMLLNISINNFGEYITRG